MASHEAWHHEPVSFADGSPTGRSIIRDENGLFVAECISEDAPLIVNAPAMAEALRHVVIAYAGVQGVHPGALEMVRAVLARVGVTEV